MKQKKPNVNMNKGIYTIIVQGDLIPFTPGMGISRRIIPIKILTRKKNPDMNKESSGRESEKACQKTPRRKKI